MRRRQFITLLGGAAAAWPLAALAQQAEHMRRIAWFGLGRADVPSPYLEALRSGLRERGWVEGRNRYVLGDRAAGHRCRRAQTGRLRLERHRLNVFCSGANR